MRAAHPYPGELLPLLRRLVRRLVEAGGRVSECVLMGRTGTTNEGEAHDWAKLVKIVIEILQGD